MVEEVRIQNLGVIEEAVLELSPGFNVVTGETGAGKTMVVTSLGLLFGGRADPQRVRPGADRASAEGRSRAHMGGRQVPVATLINVADDLVAVHGQSDQQRLLQPGRQRAALDRFAGDKVTKPLRGYLAAYRRHRDVA